MDKKILELEFKDAQDKKFFLRIDDPKNDLDEEKVSAAMSRLIGFDVLANREVDIKEAVAAREIVTTVSEYSI
ncbi:DUF2922 domain-containing protein [Microaceticoccus formicicus]|uniref:DUF2922 domain-containing protein n=1 Tax=Microaceticoccus formicicus TaxID=3118105 RepID=UPI003CD03D3E|nr:DUF2922 domain-containing protein [Peptoniphilaceae bacterium AMB_02]